LPGRARLRHHRRIEKQCRRFDGKTEPTGQFTRGPLLAVTDYDAGPALLALLNCSAGWACFVAGECCAAALLRCRRMEGPAKGQTNFPLDLSPFLSALPHPYRAQRATGPPKEDEAHPKRGRILVTRLWVEPLSLPAKKALSPDRQGYKPARPIQIRDGFPRNLFPRLGPLETSSLLGIPFYAANLPRREKPRAAEKRRQTRGVPLSGIQDHMGGGAWGVN